MMAMLLWSHPMAALLLMQISNENKFPSYHCTSHPFSLRHFTIRSLLCKPWITVYHLASKMHSLKQLCNSTLVEPSSNPLYYHGRLMRCELPFIPQITVHSLYSGTRRLCAPSPDSSVINITGSITYSYQLVASLSFLK